ncbi:hypothetical protein [Microbacterium aureliae]
MSITAIATAPAPRRQAAPARRLQVVEAPRPRRRPRLAYGIVAVVGAVAIAAAQMTLSILTTQTSYEMSALNQQQRELDWQAQILYDEVAGLSSPQYLAANATALGMVIDESPSYLRLSDGKILGSSGAAEAAASVNALGRGSVPNALIAQTPLVTDPGASVGGPAGAGTAVDPTLDTPVPLTDGLPTPSTH